MKKRLLALSAMMLCVVMMLSSCALFTSTIKFEDFIKKGAAPETDPTPTKFDKLDLKGSVQGYDEWYDSYYSDNGDLIILSDIRNKTTTVYNIATNEVIWSETGSQDVTYTVVLKTLYIDSFAEEPVELVVVSKRTVSSTGSDAKEQFDLTVLNESGEKIVELNDVNKNAVSKSWIAADLFCIENKVYRISANGKAMPAFDWSDLRETPDRYMQIAGDFYVFESDRSVFIYDKNLALTATYAIPLYDDEDSPYMVNSLANGNVLVQYLVRQDAMAEKYTVLVEGEKYNLYSVLIEAKSGKVKDLKLDYIIYTAASSSSLGEFGVSEKSENVAFAYAIEDQRINMNEDAAKIVSLTNKGKIAGVLELPVPGAIPSGGFELVAQNRWTFYTIDGREFVVNEKGDVIGEMSNADNSNDSYILCNQKLYDDNFNLVIDLQKEDATSIQMLSNSVLFHTDKNEVKLYANGKVKTVISESDAKEGKLTLKELSNGAYMIIDTTGNSTKYEIYNELGDLLGTITDTLSTPTVLTTAYNGALLIAAQTDNGMKYYRVG